MEFYCPYEYALKALKSHLLDLHLEGWSPQQKEAIFEVQGLVHKVTADADQILRGRHRAMGFLQDVAYKIRDEKDDEKVRRYVENLKEITKGTLRSESSGNSLKPDPETDFECRSRCDAQEVLDAYTKLCTEFVRLSSLFRACIHHVNLESTNQLSSQFSNVSSTEDTQARDRLVEVLDQIEQVASSLVVEMIGVGND